MSDKKGAHLIESTLYGFNYKNEKHMNFLEDLRKEYNVPKSFRAGDQALHVCNSFLSWLQNQPDEYKPHIQKLWGKKFKQKTTQLSAPLPNSIHKKLKALSKSSGRSLNATVMHLIAEAFEESNQIPLRQALENHTEDIKQTIRDELKKTNTANLDTRTKPAEHSGW